MKNLWSDKEAGATIRRYARDGVNRDLALRVYTSRLLGGEPKLVLHGGGNTSVKTTMTDLIGEAVEVLCIKGSGWDMGDIEPAGLPAVRLEPLRKMVKLRKLSEEDMVNAQRTNLLDSASPNPSVETLLHAFLPHKFIDHTHANAVLSLTDQPNGEAICRKLYGRKMGYVPYIMSGFDLARKALEVYLQDPRVEGLILLQHGIFTFGETANQAYTRMIRAVSKAEAHIRKNRKTTLKAAAVAKKTMTAVEVAPILRGLVALPGDDGAYSRLLLDFRTSKQILTYVGGRSLKRYANQGTVTPDHVIRTKPKPLIVPLPSAGGVESFKKAAAQALADYQADYHAYFKRNNRGRKPPKTELDPMPRVILVPGVGLFGLGNSGKAAGVAADLAEANIEVITDAESIGRYQAIAESDQFDIEYWAPEQAKLGPTSDKPLLGQVAVVTGAASGIGLATARLFAGAGAAVAILDLDGDQAEEAGAEFGGHGLACDVTDDVAVKAAFAKVAGTFGGVDILISNAGAAWQGRIGEVDEALLRKSFELNFWGHQNVAQAAVGMMKAQGTGGCLLFNTSKQALNPGKDFGPYGLPKAATLFLMKQYACDHGGDGIRSNAVNADRIRSGLLTGKMVASRSKARGLSEKDYMSGNLLGREVTADDVARAFLHLALSPATTAATLTVDGGNIEASLR